MRDGTAVHVVDDDGPRPGEDEGEGAEGLGQGLASHHRPGFTAKTFTLQLKQDNDNGKFYFEPAQIKAPKGSTVTVELSNVGSVEHNFTLGSLKIDKDVEPDKSVETRGWEGASAAERAVEDARARHASTGHAD